MNARAQDKRTWLGGGAALAVFIALVGWFLVIQPKMSAAATVRTETESVQLENVVLASKITKLRAQNAKVRQLTGSLRAAVAALPFDTGLPEFTRQISAQATEDGVTLDSIEISAAAAIVGTAATGPAGPPTTGAGASGALLSIPITLLSSGRADKQREFLHAIQIEGPRRALVTSSQLTPKSGSKSIETSATMSVQLNVFTAPLSAPAQAQLEKLLRGNVSR